MSRRIPSRRNGVWRGLLFFSLFAVLHAGGASAQTTPATKQPITLPPAAQAPATKPATALVPAAQAPATQQAVATPPAGQAPASATATPAASTADAVPSSGGLCQCLGNDKSLAFTCPGSVEACRTQCGAQFSFKPDATCPGGP